MVPFFFSPARLPFSALFEPLLTSAFSALQASAVPLNPSGCSALSASWRLCSSHGLLSALAVSLILFATSAFHASCRCLVCSIIRTSICLVTRPLFPIRKPVSRQDAKDAEKRKGGSIRPSWRFSLRLLLGCTLPDLHDSWFSLGALCVSARARQLGSCFSARSIAFDRICLVTRPLLATHKPVSRQDAKDAEKPQNREESPTGKHPSCSCCSAIPLSLLAASCHSTFSSSAFSVPLREVESTSHTRCDATQDSYLCSVGACLRRGFPVFSAGAVFMLFPDWSGCPTRPLRFMFRCSPSRSLPRTPRKGRPPVPSPPRTRSGNPRVSLSSCYHGIKWAKGNKNVKEFKGFDANKGIR